MITKDLKLYELHSLSEMEKIRESWNHLVLQSPVSTPFQTWEWNVGIAKFQGDRVRLRIVVAEDKDGEVVGIAPFWIRSTGLPGLSVLEFIGNHASDYLDLIFLEPYKDLFVRQLLEWIEQNTEWRILELQNLRRDSMDLIHRSGAMDVEPMDVCPYAVLPESVELYEQTLPKSLRDVRRKRRQLEGQGRLAFSISRTASELKADLPVLFDLHQRRQGAKGERGRFFNRQWREAFQEMSSGLVQAGFLRLGMLRIEGQPAACTYNLRLRNREHEYITGINPSLSRHSAGQLLRYWMIGEGIKDGVKVYDCGRGNELYKSWWTNETCQLFQMMRARTKIEAMIWRESEYWRNKLYRSRLIKRLYHATVGRFQHSIREEKDHAS